MASLVVVDSDLLIDFLRGRGEGVALVRALITTHRLRFTAVTAFELRLGTTYLAQRDLTMRILRSRTLPLDLAAGLRAGGIHADLLAKGRSIGLADALQAGICLRHGLPFATRNRNHFERIPQLELIDLTSI
ncbi:MAG: type II toxin-antitoxin system VapC family toxin [Acidimicrobiia bacterium]